MTEAEWLACGDPKIMFRFVRHRTTDRIIRLFAIMACRHSETLGAHESLEFAVDVAENALDGVATQDDMAEALQALEWGMSEPCESLNHLTDAVRIAFNPLGNALASFAQVVDSLGAIYPLNYLEGRGDEGWPIQCALLRELMPFRPIGFDPAWRTSTALAIAQQMYESREFGAMPILADALQDAGCNNEIALAHCRDPQQVHVRGCWVVDLVLGK